MNATWRGKARMLRALLALPSLLAMALAAPASGKAPADGPDEAEFRDPPPEARPRVWWHWLNGNISRDGIAKDLAWMKRVGIGGIQTFDVNFQTPDVVPSRLAYMTDAWRDAFRFAASEADRLGLELTVASSPGWSLTGGPWVKPRDGLKKVVWVETVVDGARQGPIRLGQPHDVPGPFQDIPLNPEPGASPDHAPPRAYGDIAILAFPAAAPATLPVPAYAMQDGQSLDGGTLADGLFNRDTTLRREADGSASVTMAYPAPQTVRSLVAHLPGAADMFNGPAVSITLESSDDGGDWKRVARFEPTIVPSTIGFDPVTARRFRLRLDPIDALSPIDRLSVPGYAGINYSLFLRQKPIKLAELRLLGEPKVDQFETKAGFGLSRDYHALAAHGTASEPGVAPTRVIDLTARLRPDGTLDWTPPPGTWRVLRLGWSLTGKTNHPAPSEATGLEVDKLDGEAVRAYMNEYVARYRATVGDALLGQRGVNAILTDSTEIGAFNWSPGLPAEFQRLRGYDLLPWLPVLAGEVVGSRAQSDAFLYDFRRTIAELHASEHYRAVAEVAHANGLRVYGEALEGWRVSLGDDIDMRRFTDVPMAAMWAYPQGVGPRPLLVGDIRSAAASAHLRGKAVVAAESMTSSRFPWAMGPADLRRIADTEFANGINRIVVHTSPHQPADDRQPGLSLRHIGQFFTRHETWAEMARPWVDYIARSSYLLQQGRFAADVAVFAGEDAPASVLFGQGRLEGLPTRHAYDYVNATTLLRDMSVDAGDLVTPGGARFRALFLTGTSGQMTLPVLRRIHQLVREGATIVGTAPVSTPSLADDRRAFDRLVARMWPGRPITRLGSGRIVDSRDLESALGTIGVPADVAGADGSALPVNFVHRKLPDGEIYYLQNPGSAPLSSEASFRVAGKVPEIWDAVSGTVRPSGYRTVAGRTVVPVEIAAENSLFIVFRKPAEQQSLELPSPDPRPVMRIAGPWSVAFQAGRGAPAKLDLPELAPLNESAQAGVRYFSGEASYTTSFTAPESLRAGDSVSLDLGSVGDVAEVRVNGKPAGILWAAPWRIEIGHLLVPGRNALEVKVANLWQNRLIGDAQPGAAPVAWTAAPMYRADAPLRPSGLIGPVTLQLTSEPRP